MKKENNIDDLFRSRLANKEMKLKNPDFSFKQGNNNTNITPQTGATKLFVFFKTYSFVFIAATIAIAGAAYYLGADSGEEQINNISEKELLPQKAAPDNSRSDYILAEDTQSILQLRNTVDSLPRIEENVTAKEQNYSTQDDNITNEAGNSTLTTGQENLGKKKDSITDDEINTATPEVTETAASAPADTVPDNIQEDKLSSVSYDTENNRRQENTETKPDSTENDSAKKEKPKREVKKLR